MTATDEIKNGKQDESTNQSREIGSAIVTVLFVTLSVSDFCEAAWVSGAGWGCLAVMCLVMAATKYLKLGVDKNIVDYVSLVLGVVGIGLILGAPSKSHHHASTKSETPAVVTSSATPGT